MLDKETPVVRFAAVGEPEVVFRWEEQRCDDQHIPDSPARAIRRSDGGIALIAAHFTNVLLLGEDFDHLAPVCQTASRGAESDDPAAYDDRFWVQAMAPLPDGRVLGIGSHEYMGARHPGRCADPKGADCWYSSIVALAADQRDWRFRPLPPEQRIVAASPAPYTFSSKARSGFFSVTNILFDGDHAYMLVYTEGIPGQPTGMCLFRAPKNDLTNGWRALSRGRFDAAFPSPYRKGAGLAEPCDVIGGPAFRSVRSVVRLGERGPWAAVMVGRAADAGAGGAEETGVVYSLSSDLRNWSEPRLLWRMTPFQGQPQAGVYFQYPSLIDHASPSPVFDTAGDRVWLYMTRFNLINRKQGMNRDLVRLRFSITR